MLDMNLGLLEEPHMVKVSVRLDEEFRSNLNHVLLSYKDVIAWNYIDMHGIDH